ncbi:MAG TPA: 50S ribosomal protein L21 [Saprospiraceae bacterium]|nr:50S ribosomal protein L21 [Saprospiraceae bacterium]HRG21021.1 50S ribosomal protein L21 [Saprospiraceae bacterium]HRG64991.1 50S ribosomal protein L21 [Saprospiraceae bacterium]
MLAIVNIAGQQFKVSKDQEIFVHQLEANAGDSVNFDQVLMTFSDAGTTVGTPVVNGASVRATVLGHQKGDKVIVFKKKRRKGYRKKNGHRQSFTKIKIDSINL